MNHGPTTAMIIREPSRPQFLLGDWALVKATSERGKIVDAWEEPGPLHCYTLRIGSTRLQDFCEDELERP